MDPRSLEAVGAQGRKALCLCVRLSLSVCRGPSLLLPSGVKLKIGPVGAIPKCIGAQRANTASSTELWLALWYLLPHVFLMWNLTMLAGALLTSPVPSSAPKSPVSSLTAIH